MGLKSIVAAVAAVTLTVTPTITVAQTAARTQVAPAGETVAGSELRGDRWKDNAALIAALLGVTLTTYLIIKFLLHKSKEQVNDIQPRPTSP